MQWFTYIISYDAANLENIVKIYVPMGSIFAGPVTGSPQHYENSTH